MTYNEWRDELKNNLLGVSESEQRRVLDYYAEAYADRREAGFSEREIIEQFGAPYDAAQRILSGSCEQFTECDYEQNVKRAKDRRHNSGNEEFFQSADKKSEKQREDYTWVFVLLCIICCVPLCGLIVAMVGITVGFCVAPFVVLISGIATLIGGICAIVSGEAIGGICAIGIGIIIAGLGIILIPLFIKLVGLMWELFNKFFSWLKSLFSGKGIN